MSKLRFALALFALVGCTSTHTPAVCLDSDLTPDDPGEPIATADEACSAVRNVTDTRFIALDCGPPPDPASCPYLTSAMARFPQHVWFDCVESIRLATTCNEVLDRRALCWCLS